MIGAIIHMMNKCDQCGPFNNNQTIYIAWYVPLSKDEMKI